jgi:hypothetical protein
MRMRRAIRSGYGPSYCLRRLAATAILSPPKKPRALPPGSIRPHAPLRPRRVRRDFLGPDPDALVIERFSQLGEAVHPDGLAQATRMLFDCDGIALAASVSAPALILAGTHDTVAPVSEHAGPLCDAMQEAELKTLDGCGQYPQARSTGAL